MLSRLQCSWHTLVLIILGILGFWLGFHNALLHIPPLVLLYPIVLNFLGAQAYNKTDALRKGWITGLFGASAVLYWIAVPVHDVGNLPWFLAIPCALGMGAYVGLYGGIFCLFAFLLRNHPPMRRAFALGILWYFLELLRNWFLTGFPWAVLSAAFVPWVIIIQGISIVGTYALSGIITSGALLMAESLFPSYITTVNTYSPKCRQTLGFSSISIALMLIFWGIYAVHTDPINTETNATNTFAVVMVEGNIDQNIKWESHLQKATIDIYTDLSRVALKKLAEQATHEQRDTLLLWPETSMPFYLEHHPQWSSTIVRFVQDIKVPLLLGAPGAVRKNDGTIELFNRAYLLNKNGQISGFYDKAHLVPFGEYLPWWLHLSFLEPLLQGVGNFTPGKIQSPLSNFQGNTRLALGMLICYESIFPEIAQQHVENGANVLVVLSNDGWFGDSAAPAQHLQLSMLRAVEQNRWFIRSTNTGISAITDNKGRIRLYGTQFQRQSLIGSAQTIEEHSIFYYIASWIPPAAFCVLLLLLCPKCSRSILFSKGVNKK